MTKEKGLNLAELIKPLAETIKEKKEEVRREAIKKVRIETKKNNENKAKKQIKRKSRRNTINTDRFVWQPGDLILVSRDQEPAQEEAKWGLVLMGGGARALAHIGVLEALLDNDLLPPIITGTSMGAVIGGLFAAGYFPRELEKLGRQLSYGRLANLRKTRIPLPEKLVDYLSLESYQKRLLRQVGLTKGDPLEKDLRSLVGDLLIEDLPLRFGCNAVDLVSGREIFFTAGPLFQALRASIAFPLIIDPARLPGQLLVDGGLLNNCPVRLARELGAARVFVPDVHRPLKKMPIRRFDSTFSMVNRLVQVVLSDSTDSRLPEADLVIKINPNVDTFDFTSVRRVVNLGRKITLDNIQAIKEMVRQVKQVKEEH